MANKKLDGGSLVNEKSEGYGVGHLPGLKRPALYRKLSANSFAAVASFRDEAQAADFWEWLLKVTGAAQARGQGFGKKRKGKTKP